jgi:hypothetical protein
MDGRDPQFSEQSLEDGTKLLASRLVESGQRLVEQHQLRVRRQYPGERHTLPLAAAERARSTFGKCAKSELIKEIIRAPVARGAASALAEADVLAHRKMRKERRVLEHNPNPAGFWCKRRDVPSTEHDLPGGGLSKPRDRVEQHRLASSRWSENREDLVRGDRQVDRAKLE